MYYFVLHSNNNVETKYLVFNIKKLNVLFVPSILITVVGFVEALIIPKKKNILLNIDILFHQIGN